MLPIIHLYPLLNTPFLQIALTVVLVMVGGGGGGGGGGGLTLPQFMQALEAIAVRLYSPLIEKRIGINFDCLLPTQQAVAARSALDVLLKRKILPHAERLGFVIYI
jgi:hypothetical protein